MALRFRISDTFLLDGRGTAVVGFVEHGEVVVGDRLILERSAKAVTVAAVEGVGNACWTPGSSATPVGLLVPGLTLNDVLPGDVLVHE